jgi:membrane protease YdiL (CAAX protease family)
MSLGVALTAAVGALLILDGVEEDGTSVRLSTLRLVVGTAFGEELIHRGALFALWSSTGSSPQMVAVANGIAFGAWHIAGVRSQGWVGRASEVFVPAIAGTALFLWGRCRSKSVAGSWALHLATNLPGHAIRVT